MLPRWHGTNIVVLYKGEGFKVIQSDKRCDVSRDVERKSSNRAVAWGGPPSASDDTWDRRWGCIPSWGTSESMGHSNVRKTGPYEPGASAVGAAWSTGPRPRPSGASDAFWSVCGGIKPREVARDHRRRPFEPLPRPRLPAGVLHGTKRMMDRQEETSPPHLSSTPVVSTAPGSVYYFQAYTQLSERLTGARKTIVARA